MMINSSISQVWREVLDNISYLDQISKFVLRDNMPKTSKLLKYLYLSFFFFGNLVGKSKNKN